MILPYIDYCQYVLGKLANFDLIHRDKRGIFNDIIYDLYHYAPFSMICFSPCYSMAKCYILYSFVALIVNWGAFGKQFCITEQAQPCSIT